VFGVTGTPRKPGLSAGLLCLREQVLLDTLSSCSPSFSLHGTGHTEFSLLRLFF
jgi:hypothetical protein